MCKSDEKGKEKVKKDPLLSFSLNFNIVKIK